MKRALYVIGILILFTLVGIIIWEVAAFLFFPHATISLFAEELTKTNPFVSHVITMVFGMLVGHWFIPRGGSL